MVLSLLVFIYKIKGFNTTIIYDYFMSDRLTKRKS